MGAFFLVRHNANPKASRTVSSIEKCLLRQEFGVPRAIDRPMYSLRIYKKRNISEDNYFSQSQDNFAFSTGTFIYKESIGAEALRRFLEDFDIQNVNWSEVHGHFCVGVNIGNVLYLLTDRLGIYHVYCDSSKQVYSSSFLAVLESLDSARMNTQSIYEYVFDGATYGNRTVFNEIDLVDQHCMLRISDKVSLLPYKNGLVRRIEDDRNDRNVADDLAVLRHCFGILTKCFGSNISMGLSGGRDSRLMLALLLEQGIQPQLYVYGKKDSVDVQVAMQIAKGEGFSIEHIDRSAFPRPNLSEFPATVERNFYAFDGYPQSGIFDNGSDLATRLQRSSAGQLVLNATAAEVFRLVFELADIRLTIPQVLRRCSTAFDPSSCTSTFDEKAYLSTLADKNNVAGHVTHHRLGRNAIEALYVDIRCRYWGARTPTINNRFGWAMTPFLDVKIVESAASLPFKDRVYGRYLGRLIREVSPALAKYPSAYGHNFQGEPTVRRKLSFMAMHLRKTYLPFINAYRAKLGVSKWLKRPFPFPLCSEYIGTAIDPAFPYLSQFFHVARVVDPEHYARICTLEYLFEKYQSSLTTASKPLVDSGI